MGRCGAYGTRRAIGLAVECPGRIPAHREASMERVAHMLHPGHQRHLRDIVLEPFSCGEISRGTGADMVHGSRSASERGTFGPLLARWPGRLPLAPSRGGASSVLV